MMSTLEISVWLLLFVAVMCIGVSIIHDCIELSKQLKKEREDWQLFKESLQVDSLWIERDAELPENPFHTRKKRMAIIQDTREDSFNDLWIKFKDFETGEESTCQAFDFYEKFESFNKNSDQM